MSSRVMRVSPEFRNYIELPALKTGMSGIRITEIIAKQKPIAVRENDLSMDKVLNEIANLNFFRGKKKGSMLDMIFIIIGVMVFASVLFIASFMLNEFRSVPALTQTNVSNSTIQA